MKKSFADYVTEVKKRLGDRTLTPAEIGYATYQFVANKPATQTVKLIIQKRNVQ